MSRLRTILTTSLIILLPSLLPAKTVTVPANDPRIQVMGRADLSDKKAPKFDWPAVSVRVAVKGPSLTFLVEDPGGNNYLNLSVDGKSVSVVDTQAGLNRIEVPGLGKGKSIVALSKRTEGYQGAVVFKGLELGEGTSLQDPTPLPSRKIEFIGDSWTCGYGNEGVTHGNCPNLSAVSNADLAFPAVLAKRMKAQYHVTGVSGRGILRNYGDKKPISDTNMPLEYGRTLFSDSASKWDCSRWVPDVVVLRLGVNDYSTQPAPEEADFVKAYAAFLERLRSCYPKAEIFCFADEGWPDYKPKILKAIEERNAKGDRRVRWVGNRGFSPSELGCDWHPAVKAHEELAELLEGNIRPVVGWNDWTPPEKRTDLPKPTPTTAANAAQGASPGAVQFDFPAPPEE